MISTRYRSLIGFQTQVGLTIKYIIGLFSIVVLLNSCSIVKPIEFEKVNSFNAAEKSGKMVFTSNLTLHNPNGFQFIINKADIDVYAEGINLGKLEIPDMISIEKKKDFTGDFTVEISLVKLLMAGKNVLPKLKQGDVLIELKGNVEADVLWMHRDFAVNYKEKISLKN